MQLFQLTVSWVAAFPYWEATAVILAIAYLLLAVKESIWCWYCALFSTAIYTLLFWNVSLLMESALNVYYLVMALFGWYQWQKGGTQHQGIQITRWSVKTHFIIIALTLLASAISGYFLQRHTTAALPYLDSFTTWASVITTYMVAKKVLENWLYWLVIDSLSIYLYLERGLTLTAWLFVAYVIIVCFGFIKWKQQYSTYPISTRSEPGLA